ncbi:MAG TPA: hypothetical protein VNA20_05320 [Frankiaceae bacterium]|nr:hypothetical protein [Frankiaceae bacterium]
MARVPFLKSLVVGSVSVLATILPAPAAHAAGGCAVGAAVNVGAGVGFPPPAAFVSVTGAYCQYRSGGGTVAYSCSAVSICTVRAGGVTFTCALTCSGTVPSVPVCALVSVQITGVGGHGIVADLNAGVCLGNGS